MFITATAMAVTTVVVFAGSLLLSGMVEGPTNPPIGASPAPATESPSPLVGDETSADDLFELTVTTPRTTWSTDEPIEFSATLTYIGEEPAVTVIGARSGIVGFGVEQLDGPVDMGPAWRPSAREYDFAKGDTIEVPFAKSGGSGGFDPEGPMAGFWESWFEDPELRLPAGEYRLSAVASYGLPDAGNGLWTEIGAELSIEVVDDAMPPLGASQAPAIESPSPEPPAPVASPEAATPSPAPDLGIGSPTMSAERDGVVLEVWLDRTSLPVGERLHALVRVSNTGTTDVLWQTNICGTGPAETTIDPARPPDTGVEWTGRAATFKRLLLDGELAPGLLWDASTIDLENVFCHLWAAIKPFEPGSTAEMTVAWDAVDQPGRPIVPGPATVTSTFETWTPRERPAQPGDSDQELVASTTIEIVGETGTAVPVARYADIALSDDSFRTWVETSTARPRSWDPYAIYWPNDEGVYPDDPRYEGATEGTVDIGMFLGDGPHGEVTIDLATLEALGSKLDGKVKVTDETASAVVPSSVAGTEEPDGEETTGACPALFTSAPIGTVAESGSTEVDIAAGRWRPMARAPFGIDTDLAAWTGRRMIATRWDDGRSATYDPRLDRWREIAPAPRGFNSQARAVWTGREFIILQADDDGPGVEGVAYDPGADRWRQIEPHPAELDGEDYGITRPLWSGTHVLVLGPRGDLSAYEPDADCWVELSAMPGDDWATGLYQVGSRLLVESRGRTEDVVSMRAFDAATATWSDPVPGPLAVQAAENGSSVIGDRLVYVSWIETDDEAVGAWNAFFDPATMNWSTFEHDCETLAFRPTIVAGDVLMANDGRRAIDGETLACIDLPKPPRDFNGTEIVVWTGSELIVWSGHGEGPSRRGGFVYDASP